MGLSPSIEVIGLYSPRASTAECAKFIRKYVEDADPANFDIEALEGLRRLGRNPVALTESERGEIAEEIEYHLE